MAACSGGGLALCGLVLQSLLRNPLAEPYLLGISAGASTGAVMVMLLGIGSGVLTVGSGAFAGACLAFGLIILLSRGMGKTPGASFWPVLPEHSCSMRSRLTSSAHQPMRSNRAV